MLQLATSTPLPSTYYLWCMVHGAWHLATLKRFQLRLAMAIGYRLPPANAKRPKAVTKVGPNGHQSACCKNYCNSHHLERILMAIEWPSNTARILYCIEALDHCSATCNVQRATCNIFIFSFFSVFAYAHAARPDAP